MKKKNGVAKEAIVH